MSFSHPKFIPQQYWWWARRPLWLAQVLIIGFGALVIYEMPTVVRNHRDVTAVPQIMAAHITLDDVLGTNLPPEPDPKQVDKTLQGVDANKNGIRDDVEFALFKLHPDDIVLRAAQLQYAFALQMYFTNVFSEGTLNAVNLQNSRASFCLWNTVPLPWSDRSQITQELSTQVNIGQDKITKEIKELFFNTQRRVDTQNNLFKKYLRSAEPAAKPYCDISKDILSENILKTL